MHDANGSSSTDPRRDRRGNTCSRSRRIAANRNRAALEVAWLRLTRETLPALAAARGWPVRADHCFQRILLDHAFGGCWYDHVSGRPAYAHADAQALARAVALGDAAITGAADMAALNARSLAWRGKRRG